MSRGAGRTAQASEHDLLVIPESAFVSGLPVFFCDGSGGDVSIRQ